MELGWRGSRVEGSLGFIASFPLCPPLPIQAYAIITRLALPLTIFTFWSFLSTLDLAVLAWPIVFSNGGCNVDSYTLTNSHCDYASWAPHFPASWVEAFQCWIKDGKVIEALGYCSSSACASVDESSSGE